MKTAIAAYYVSAVSGKKSTLLVGPFATHEEALGYVEPARKEAEKYDAWAVHYAFGTVKVVATQHLDGSFNARVGFAPA